MTQIATYMAITMKALQVLAVLVTLQTLGYALHCHATLSNLLSGENQTSNSRMSFLHGVHKINKYRVLFISLTPTAYSSHPTKIICIKPTVLAFQAVNLVTLLDNPVYCPVYQV